jgi:hypothetical protein
MKKGIPDFLVVRSALAYEELLAAVKHCSGFSLPSYAGNDNLW